MRRPALPPAALAALLLSALGAPPACSGPAPAGAKAGAAAGGADSAGSTGGGADGAGGDGGGDDSGAAGDGGADGGPSDGADGGSGALDVMYGYVKWAPTGAALEGVRTFAIDREGDPEVTSDAAGRWTWQVAEREWITFRSEHPLTLPMEAYIHTGEADNSAIPYPYTLGSSEDVNALCAPLGVTQDPALGFLMVDALDPQDRDIGGATVTVDVSYDGPYREYATDQWDMEPLTTDDRNDLMYLNLPPGPVHITVTGLTSGACAGPAAVELKAGVLTQVSFYCDEDAPGYE